MIKFNNKKKLTDQSYQIKSNLLSVKKLHQELNTTNKNFKRQRYMIWFNNKKKLTDWYFRVNKN